MHETPVAHTSPTMTKTVWATLAAITLFALLTRLYDLGLRELWLDEGYSVWFAERDWSYLWTETPKFETHPPLFYSILKLWRMAAPDDEFSLRLLPTLAGVATVPVMFFAGRLAGGLRHGNAVGLLAAFLFACAKLQLFYAQNLRPYTFFFLAMMLTVTCVLWLIRNPDAARMPLPRLFRHDRKTLLAFIGLGIGLALLQWFQNVGLIYIFSVGIFLIGWWAIAMRGNLALFGNLLFSMTLMALIYAPYLGNFLAQFTSFQGGFWLSAPELRKLITQSSRIFPQSLDSVSFSIRLLIYGLTILPVAAFGGLAMLFHRDRETFPLSLLFFLAMASFGAWGISLAVTYGLQPMFMERTLIPAQATWLILLALAPFALQTLPRRIAIVLLAGMFLAGTVEYMAMKDTAPNNVTRPTRAIAKLIAESEWRDAPVIVIPNHNALPLEYYEKQMHVEFDLRPLPEAYPAVNARYDYPIGGRGVPATPPEDADAMIRSLSNRPAFWLVTHGHSGNERVDKQNDPDRYIEGRAEQDYVRNRIYNDGRAMLILYTRK